MPSPLPAIERVYYASRFDAQAEAEEISDEGKTFISVRPVKPQNSRVILWERDELHPQGQAFVYGQPKAKEQQVYSVGMTDAVSDLLKAGVLEQVDALPPAA